MSCGQMLLFVGIGAWLGFLVCACMGESIEQNNEWKD
jgi:hypothetical protein